MSKLKNIIEGWKNAIWPNAEVEVLAAKRAIHCSACEHSVEMLFEVIQEKKIEEIKGMGCAMCLCPLTTKLRSPEEECPLEKW